MTCENDTTPESSTKKAVASSVAAAPLNGASTGVDTSSTNAAGQMAGDSSSSSNTSGVNMPAASSQTLANIHSQLQAHNLQQQQRAYFSNPVQLQQQFLMQHNSAGITPPRLDQYPQLASSSGVNNRNNIPTTSSQINHLSLASAPAAVTNPAGATASKATELAKILAAARQLRATQVPLPQVPAPAAATLSNGSDNKNTAAAVLPAGSAVSSVTPRQGDFAWELLQRLASQQVNQLLNKQSNHTPPSQPVASRHPGNVSPTQQQDPNSSFASTSNNRLAQNVAYCPPVATPHPVEVNTNTATTNDKAVTEEENKVSYKAAKKHPPNTVILPCRARGMDVDHNFRTAHFVIHSKVGHGEDLICSNEACRTSGVKFRYCTSCRIPVAKRTFHQRHSHGIPTVYGENSNTKIEEAASLKTHQQSNVKKSVAKQKKRVAVNEQESSPKKRNQPFASLKCDDEIRNQRPVANVIVRVDQKKQVSEESGGTTDISDTSAGFDTAERRRCWASLLSRRPDSSDGDRMTAWLDEVMAVSNPKNVALKMEAPPMKSITSSKGCPSFKKKRHRGRESSPKKGRDEKRRYRSSSKRRHFLKRKSRSKKSPSDSNDGA